MMEFNDALSNFKNNHIRQLSLSDDGMRFLKLRSLSRKNQMEHLIEKADFDFGNIKSKDWLKRLYESSLTEQMIDEAIQELYEIEREKRRNNENDLVNELYKVQSFEWGGLHRNSLEKTIVDNYVKKIKSYDILNSVIENELHNSMRAYVLASWYNHWTSIIIEDIFKDHENVIPAVGLIKKVDFFTKSKPFDLKVTYLPEGYIKDKRKESELRPELTLMKRLARNLNIAFDKEAPDSFLIPDLWRKLEDHPDSKTDKLLSELQECRECILDDCIENPDHLVLWLYENQGVRRFDASNRLFLVLVNKGNFFESWKLKRAKPLIEGVVNDYLDKVGDNPGFELKFDWEGDTYITESDAIFVLKE